MGRNNLEGYCVQMKQIIYSGLTTAQMIKWATLTPMQIILSEMTE